MCLKRNGINKWWILCFAFFLQVKVTQELKNTHTEQMTRLHFKHQTECDLLEDMRYEHVSETRVWQSVQMKNKTHHTGTADSYKSMMEETADRARKEEEGAQDLWRSGMRKGGGGRLSCSRIFTVQRVRKTMKEFPAAFFLLSGIVFIHSSSFLIFFLSSFAPSCFFNLFYCWFFGPIFIFLANFFWLSSIYLWRVFVGRFPF